MAASGRAAAAPILSLYREIMHVHKAKLAGPLKDIGNDYVRSEFKSHLKSSKTTQEQWKQFVTQWRDYLSFIDGRADAKTPLINTSGELSEEVLGAMSPDQRKRMDLLKEEAKKLGSPAEDRNS